MVGSNMKKSGWEFKKQREARENERTKQMNTMKSFFTKSPLQVPSTSGTSNVGAIVDKNITSTVGDYDEPPNKRATFHGSINVATSENSETSESNLDPAPLTDTSESEVDTPPSVPISTHEENVYENDTVYEISSDPAKWNNITDQFRQLLIKKGTLQITEFDFPINNKGRQFSPSFYNRCLPNGEKILRSWLIYSTSQDAVFCFGCKLFSKLNHNWAICGYSDWSHLSRALKTHESSNSHFQSIISWKELDSRLKTENTVDAALQRAKNMQVNKWQKILKRIISIIQFLATQSLAIRGSNENINDRQNGNFLKLFELLAKFDQTAADHVQSISTKETQIHYLSHTIQNELIELISKKIKNHIIDLIKINKYYSIIVDCTPDQSHVEQMSIIIRFVMQNLNSGDFEIREHFIGFVPVINTSGEGLTNKILHELNTNHIPIEDMRGQGYDNGANMKGKRIGVQRRIMEINPRATFIPCACHSLNLVVNDAASASGEVANFFHIIQQIYVFFSSSTSRWDVLKQHVKKLTIKSVCSTRWESRISAVTPLRFQLESIYDALINIHLDENRDSQTKCEAQALAKHISCFKFICSLVLWYDILSKINIISKIMQNPKVNLLACNRSLKVALDFLRDYRSDENFLKVIDEAKKIAETMEIEGRFPNVPIVRIRRKNKQFEYESADDPILDPQLNYKINFFNFILDTAITSINERFEQMEKHTEYYEFLYNIYELKYKDKSEILKYCKDLQLILTDGENTDIDGIEICEEIINLAALLPSNMYPIEILNYLAKNNMTTIFPNLCVSLRILLTLPVSVASGERSFSKLKIIKNYLRSSMGQERLVGLSLMSIESAIAESLDYDVLIKDFAEIKVRRVPLIN